MDSEKNSVQDTRMTELEMSEQLPSGDNNRQSIRRKPVGANAVAPTKPPVAVTVAVPPELVSEKHVEAQFEAQAQRQPQQDYTPITTEAREAHPPDLLYNKEKILPLAPAYTTSTFSSAGPVPPPTPPRKSHFFSSSFLKSSSRRRTPWFVIRLREKHRYLSKKTKILIYLGLFLLTALVIGLSAGLSVHKSKSSSSSSGGKVTDLPLPSNHGGPYTGDLTYYAPGLGACGVTSTSNDAIVAVSHLLYDAVSTSSDPNQNPLCGKKIRARRNGKSVDLTVVDRCVGCKATDLDITETVFANLASVDDGRVLVDWAWLDDVPAGAANS